MTLITIWLTTQAYADPPRHLPPGERINEGTPQEKQCYSALEFRVLVQLDRRFSSCLKTQDLQKQKLGEQNSVILRLEEISDLQLLSLSALEVENTRLFELWKVENRKRHEAENKPNWGTWVAWTVAGVATIAAGGAITYALLDD